MIFIGALVQVSVTNFSIILFGENVRVVKTEAEDWGSAAIATLLSQLKFDDFDSRDADAVECALDLLEVSAARGGKKVFVLTDGFGTSGLDLPRALCRAEERNVEVVGVGVGFDRLFVSGAYQRWCTAALPITLPDAVRILYTPSERPSDLSSSGNLGVSLMVAGGGLDEEKELNDIFARKVNVFEGLAQQLSKEREATLQRGHSGAVTVDVCFVLDATGSMRPFLSSVVNDINAIAIGIPKKIEETHQGLKLKMRFSAVWFRDVGENERFGVHAFGDSDALTRSLSRVQAYGGGDLADDALGGLNHAVGNLEWKAKARFVVLMTDAPAHGYADGQSDDHPAGLDGCTADSVMKRIGVDLGADFMFCRIREEATRSFEQALRSAFENPAM